MQSLEGRDSGPPRFLGYLANVSETGAFVQSTNPKPVGTRMALQLRLPGLDARLHCEAAEIVWTRAISSADDGSPGMGVRFLTIDPHSRATLRRFCCDGGPRGATRISRG